MNSSFDEYMKKREQLIETENGRRMGWNIHLDEKEELVNQILMKYKCEELDYGLVDPADCSVSKHFFKSKGSIEKSNVFKIIQMLPKGASLHSHDTALVSGEYLYSLTYRENLYVSEEDNSYKLKFFYPKNVDSTWKSVADLRKIDGNFDAVLKTKLSLVVDDPLEAYPTDDCVWKAFMGNFTAVADMIGFKPVWEEYFYESLKELYDDNVRYLEFRGMLPEVYDLDGKIYNHVEVVDLYYQTLKRFMRDYPDFYGARFIYAPVRHVGDDVMEGYVKIYNEIKTKYPDFIAGFDLVGQENMGEPLIKFIPQLLRLKDSGTTFFFHAGETNWQGCSVDDNLFDAILLGSKRIGHGLAVLKHPQLLDAVKKNNIAIEVCPISNQVLNLVPDLRNHPAAFLIADDYPMVIAPDDPTFWGAKALSYDWYMAFMGVASKCDDLRLLKKLALNSLEYSDMTECEKTKNMERWKNSWSKFIDDVLVTYGA